MVPSLSRGGAHRTSCSVLSRSLPYLGLLLALLAATPARGQTTLKANDDAASTLEGSAVDVDVLANDDLPEDGIFAVEAIVRAPTDGTAVLLDLRTIRYTPRAGFTGTDSFVYRLAENPVGLTQAPQDLEAEVVVTVLTRQESNAPPVAVDDAGTTPEDVSVVIEVVANDSDPDGDVLFLPSTGFLAQVPAHGRVARFSTTSLQYIPDPDFHGFDSFRYRVSDGRTGGLDEARVAVTVDPVQDAPRARADSATTAEATPVEIDVLANDFEPDGEALVLGADSVVFPPEEGTVELVGSLEDPAGQRFRYTPRPGFAGTDFFVYRVDDPEGTPGTGSPLPENQAQVEITVTAGRPPIAVDDQVEVATGASVAIDVTANDSDPEDTVVALSTPAVTVPPAHGTVAVASATSLTYTADAGFVGPDVFEYEIRDGTGLTARARVLVTVRNTPPVAVDDTAEAAPEIGVEIRVLDNDSDPDGHPLSLTGEAIVQPPAHGTAVRASDLTVLYTADRAFTGSDAFVYEITDGQGGTARGRVEVSVTNQPPEATDDGIGTHVVTAVEVPVLRNDRDPDGHRVRLAAPAVVEPPAFGSAQALSDGTIRYLPDAGFEGTDGFSYRITDGNGGRATGRVTVEVTNNPPVAASDLAVTGLGMAVEIDVLANDRDPDGDAVRLADEPVVAGPAFGRLRLEDDRFVYTPRRRFEGVDEFQYRVTDGFGGFDQALVRIRVQEGAPPVLTGVKPSTIPEGRVTTIQLEGRDLFDAQVFVATEPPGEEEEPRVYPRILSVRPAPHGRTVVVQLDATDPRVKGFYSLIARTAHGGAAAEVRVVPEKTPVIDLVSPEEVEPGVLYPLVLTGANLEGARVRVDHPGVRLLEVDSSDPRRIAGLVKASSRAALRGFELTVIRQGRQASIPLRVVAPGTSEGAVISLNSSAEAAPGTLADPGAAAATGPRVLLQEPRVFDGLESRFRAQRERFRALAELGVASGGASGSGDGESIGCLFGLQERLQLFEKVVALPLDASGDIDFEILDRIPLGDLRRLRVLTFSTFIDAFLIVEADICSGTVFRFCFGVNAGFEIPNLPGVPSRFRGGVAGFVVCFPFGFSASFEQETDGQMDRFDLRGGRCSEVRLDPVERQQGEIFADVRLVECCSEPLEIEMGGVAFGGSSYATGYDVNQDFVEVTPDEATCTPCACAVELEPLAMSPGDQNVPLEGLLENLSDSTCRYTVEISKESGSPTVRAPANTFQVDAPPGQVRLGELIKLSMPVDSSAEDSAVVGVAASAEGQVCGATTTVCPVPATEVSQFVRWDDPINDLALFNMFLGPQEASFSGRRVSEEWRSFSDGCWVPNSRVPRFEAESIITDGVWEVQPPLVQGKNLYGSDLIGIADDLDDAYPRSLYPFGCTMTAVQEMSAHCPAPLGTIEFKENPVVIQVQHEPVSGTIICRDSEEAVSGQLGCSDLH